MSNERRVLPGKFGVERGDTLAVKAICVLSDRKGFSWWWEELDPDIRDEITAELAAALTDGP